MSFKKKITKSYRLPLKNQKDYSERHLGGGSIFLPALDTRFLGKKFRPSALIGLILFFLGLSFDFKLHLWILYVVVPGVIIFLLGWYLVDIYNASKK